MLSTCLIRFHKQSPAPDDPPRQLNQSSSSTRLLPFFLTQSSLHPCPLCSLIPNSFTLITSFPFHFIPHLSIPWPFISSSGHPTYLLQPPHPLIPHPLSLHSVMPFLFIPPVFCSPPTSLIPGSFWGSKKTKKTKASLKTATFFVVLALRIDEGRVFTETAQFRKSFPRWESLETSPCPASGYHGKWSSFGWFALLLLKKINLKSSLYLSLQQGANSSGQ